MPSNVKRPPIEKIAGIQIVILILLIVAMAMWDKKIAESFLYGSLIFLIPNYYFALHTFRYIGAAKSRQVAQSIYKGQVGKFVLTIAMFAFLFKVIKPEQVLVVFVSYAVSNVMHLLLTLLIVKRSKNILN